MKKLSLVFLISVTLPIFSFAQNKDEIKVENPPVIVESLFGNAGYAAQMTVNKSFSSFPKFGIFSVTDMSSKWGEKNPKDLMNQIHLTYQFGKGFQLLTGTHFTPVSGLRPNAAIMYTYVSKSWLISIMPRIDLSKNATWEGFAMLEYTPQLSENWKLYTRAQGVYCAVLDNGDHARSYLKLRAGVVYKEFRFGLGANFDTYGPERVSKENYGIFLAIRLFN